MKKLTKAQLEELVEEATTDAYGEAEQVGGFFTMMEDHLKMPFETEILGMQVTVESLDMTDDEDIVAMCKRGKKTQRIPIRELPIPSPPPEGAEWIEAYRHFHRGW